MNVFISWSKPRSRLVAVAMQAWLSDVFDAGEPFVAGADADGASRWFAEIGEQLDASDFGIVCVTPENMNEPWLLFESGAIAKRVGRSRLVPFLFQLESSAVTGPLAQFQHAAATEADLLRVATAVNEQMSPRLDDARLLRACATAWTAFAEALASIGAATDAPRVVVRSERDMLIEVLELVRAQARERSAGATRPVPPAREVPPDRVPRQSANNAAPAASEIASTLDALVPSDLRDRVVVGVGTDSAVEITADPNVPLPPDDKLRLMEVANRYGVELRFL